MMSVYSSERICGWHPGGGRGVGGGKLGEGGATRPHQAAHAGRNSRVIVTLRSPRIHQRAVVGGTEGEGQGGGWGEDGGGLCNQTSPSSSCRCAFHQATVPACCLCIDRRLDVGRMSGVAPGGVRVACFEAWYPIDLSET